MVSQDINNIEYYIYKAGSYQKSSWRYNTAAFLNDIGEKKTEPHKKRYEQHVSVEGSNYTWTITEKSSGKIFLEISGHNNKGWLENPKSVATDFSDPNEFYSRIREGIIEKHLTDLAVIAFTQEQNHPLNFIHYQASEKLQSPGSLYLGEYCDFLVQADKAIRNTKASSGGKLIAYHATEANNITQFRGFTHFSLGTEGAGMRVLNKTPGLLKKIRKGIPAQYKKYALIDPQEISSFSTYQVAIDASIGDFLKIPDIEAHTIPNLVTALLNEACITKQQAKDIKDLNNSTDSQSAQNAITELLLKQGYKGIKYFNEYESIIRGSALDHGSPLYSIMVFDPKDIQIVTGKHVRDYQKSTWQQLIQSTTNYIT